MAAANEFVAKPITSSLLAAAATTMTMATDGRCSAHNESSKRLMRLLFIGTGSWGPFRLNYIVNECRGRVLKSSQSALLIDRARAIEINNTQRSGALTSIKWLGEEASGCGADRKPVAVHSLAAVSIIIRCAVLYESRPTTLSLMVRKSRSFALCLHTNNIIII